MNLLKKYISLIFFTMSILFFTSAVYAKFLGAFFGEFFPVKDAAAFSLLVYQDEENTPPIPDGFILLCQCPLEFQNKDYYGEAYYRLDYGIYSDGHKADQPIGVTVVIAHRGTILKFDNLLDDLQIILKTAPNSFFTGSKPFTDYVISLTYDKFPDLLLAHTFIHTGHSLGAIHAELSYVYQSAYNYGHGNVYAITFESPGSKEMIESFMLKNFFPIDALDIAWNIEIINTDVNAINTLNQEVSPIWPIHPGYHFINIPKVDLSPIDIKYFSTLFTDDQHSMANIYDYFKNGGQLYLDDIYPVGIVNAFKYYKTYKPKDNDEHHNYWDQAFKIYWDRHNEIHAEYGSLDNYRAYMIRHHLS